MTASQQQTQRRATQQQLQQLRQLVARRQSSITGRRVVHLPRKRGVQMAQLAAGTATQARTANSSSKSSRQGRAARVVCGVLLAQRPVAAAAKMRCAGWLMNCS
jgi:hypothetical protein